MTPTGLNIQQRAGITEIFSSLQGEGTHLGEKHLFVRFEKCHIHCTYCDELGKPAENLPIRDVLQQIRKCDNDNGPHSCVSLTGGEPLLYRHFLETLCPELKSGGFRIYLETNGILRQSLAALNRWIDVIAMDMKPPSVTGEKSFLAEHKRFLEIAKCRPERELFVKIIISKKIDLEEFRAFCALIHQVYPQVPLILQPISLPDLEGHEDPALMRLLSELQKIASAYSLNARIIPRLHRILSIR